MSEQKAPAPEITEDWLQKLWDKWRLYGEEFKIPMTKDLFFLAVQDAIHSAIAEQTDKRIKKYTNYIVRQCEVIADLSEQLAAKEKEVERLKGLSLRLARGMHWETCKNEAELEKKMQEFKQQHNL